MVITSNIHFKYPDYGENHHIYAYKCLHSFTYPHYYEYSISLNLPEMPSNFEQGVFMVKLILLDDKIDFKYMNQKYIRYLELKSDRVTEKPMILKYKNEWYRMISTFVYAFPRLVSDFFGFNMFEETQRLTTIFNDHFQPNPSSYEQCILVVINNPKINIYDAKITARVKLSTFKYIFYSWFLTSSFISIVLTSWVISTFVLSLYLYRKWVLWKMNRNLIEIEESEEESEESMDRDDTHRPKIDVDDGGLLMEDDEITHKQVEKLIEEFEESEIIDINEVEEVEEENEKDVNESPDKRIEKEEEEEEIISNILFDEYDHPHQFEIYNRERKSIIDEAFEFVNENEYDDDNDETL